MLAHPDAFKNNQATKISKFTKKDYMPGFFQPLRPCSKSLLNRDEGDECDAAEGALRHHAPESFIANADGVE